MAWLAKHLPASLAEDLLGQDKLPSPHQIIERLIARSQDKPTTFESPCCHPESQTLDIVQGQARAMAQPMRTILPDSVYLS
jgi:hypothetical protein